MAFYRFKVNKLQKELVQDLLDISEKVEGNAELASNANKYAETLAKNKAKNKTAYTAMVKMQAPCAELASAIAVGGKNEQYALSEQLSDCLIELKAIPPRAPRVDLRSAAQIFENIIGRLQDELEREAEKLANKQDMLRRHPDNVLIQTQAKVIEVTISTIKKELELFQEKRLREVVLTAVDRLSKADKKALSLRNVTNEEFKVALDKFNDLVQKIERDRQITDGGIEQIMGTKAQEGVNKEATFTDNVIGITMEDRNAAQTEAAEISPEDLEEAYDDVEETIRKARKMKDAISKRMEYCQQQCDMGSEALRKMLIQRKSLPAINCEWLDTKIDELDMQISECMRDMKRFQNEYAQLNQIEAVARRAKAEKDAKKMKEFYGFVNAFTSNIEKVAMDIGNSVKKANEELEKLATVAMVADETEILTRPSTAASRTVVESDERKDEDKYADLEKKLGLRK